MKVALSIDSLIKRDHAIEVFELLCSLFEEAQIFTYIHLKGRILGPIELRRISSTYLSLKENNPDKYSFLMPFADLKVPCNLDLIINLSRGLSHGLPRCENTKQITYLYDFASLKRTTLSEKIFHSFLKKWALEKTNFCDDLILSSKSLGEQLGINNAPVIHPFVNVDDFALINSSCFKHDFFVISTEGLSWATAREIATFLQQKKIRYCLVGPDADIFKDFDPAVVLGEKCNGELAPLLASSRGLIHLGSSVFPKLAISSLLVGRPVFCVDSPCNREFLSEGIFFNDFSQLLGKYISDPKALRTSVIKFHPMGFKGQILKRINHVVKNSSALSS